MSLKERIDGFEDMKKLGLKLYGADFYDSPLFDAIVKKIDELQVELMKPEPSTKEEPKSRW